MGKKHFHFKAHLALLLANFCFGANFSVVKTVTPAIIAPFGLNILRTFFSAILFWTLFFFKPGKLGFDKKELKRFLICSLTGVTVNQLLFIKGLSLTTSIHGALLMLVTPILITIIAAWLLKEGMTIFKTIGLISGISGATMLVLSKDSSGTGSDVLQGDILIAINAMFYAFYMVMVKPLMHHYSPVHVIRWVFTFGFFMMLPFSWQDITHTNFSAFTTINWLSIVFIIVCGTFLPYLFNVYALSKLHASVAGAYMYTQPVFATIIAMLFLGEQFDWIKAFSGLLIFGGVYLSNLKSKNSSAN